jgi:hypothetical protein
MSSIGTIDSEIWSINTDRVYVAPTTAEEELDPLRLFAAGMELTGGIYNINSFYTHINVEDDTNDAEVWGAVAPGGDAAYSLARPAATTNSGTILVSQSDWDSNDAIIVRSTNYGRTWSEVARIPSQFAFQGITENRAGTRLWAGTHNAVYYSDDDGANWDQLSVVDSPSHASSSVVTCFVELPNGDMYLGCQGNIFASPEPGVIMKSTDGGLTWANEHVFGYNWTTQFGYFAINRLYYHESTDTIWALISDLTSGYGRTLWYKTGDGSWTEWEIAPTYDLLDKIGGPGSTFDILLDSNGVPTHVCGLYTNSIFGAAPIVWDLEIAEGSGGIYNVHLGSDTLISPQWPQYMYQMLDLREDTTIATPGIYVCGAQHLLRLNTSNVLNLGSYGLPFTTEMVYLPDLVTKWTPWGTAGNMEVVATGMVRIPTNW